MATDGQLCLSAVNENVSINLLLCSLSLPLMNVNNSDKNTEKPTQCMGGILPEQGKCAMWPCFVLTKSKADEYIVLT